MGWTVGNVLQSTCIDKGPCSPVSQAVVCRTSSVGLRPTAQSVQDQQKQPIPNSPDFIALFLYVHSQQGMLCKAEEVIGCDNLIISLIELTVKLDI